METRVGYRFSRYAMYTKLKSFLSTIPSCELSSCLFVGEDGTSAICNMLSEQANITYTNFPEVDIMSLPYKNSNFNCIIADQVLEHVKNPWQGIKEAYRVLKPGGYAIFTTCLMNPVHYASPEDEKEGILNDYWRFTPEGLKLLCTDFSEIIQCEGMGDFKLLYLCMSGYREKIVEPGSSLELAANGNDGRTFLHVWIIARK